MLVIDDRVEIENTGHLPNELTTETIKLPHRSYPQNPIIADALYMTAFLESWGTGVSRMVDACKAVGLPEPEYGTDGGFVWITFKRPNSVTNPDTNSNIKQVEQTLIITDGVKDGVKQPSDIHKSTKMLFFDRKLDKYLVISYKIINFAQHLEL